MTEPARPATPDPAATRKAHYPERRATPTRSGSLLRRLRERLISYFKPSAESRSAAKTGLQLLDLNWTVARLSFRGLLRAPDLRRNAAATYFGCQSPPECELAADSIAPEATPSGASVQ